MDPRNPTPPRWALELYRDLLPVFHRLSLLHREWLEEQAEFLAGNLSWPMSDLNLYLRCCLLMDSQDVPF